MTEPANPDPPANPGTPTNADVPGNGGGAESPGPGQSGPPDVLILGCGYTGRAVARQSRAAGRSVLATVRSSERADALRAEGFEVLQADALGSGIAEHVGRSTHVVVAFPPDGETERRIAPALVGAASVTYVSTTGVYADRSGRIDETTSVPAPTTPRTQRLVEAEQIYRDVGATVLRSPGIYGAERGLHVRVISGGHRIPGDGSRHVSRIHVEDLASLVIAAQSTRGRAFVVGDAEPAPHVEVVRWICETYGVPMPPFIPLEEAPVSLRGDRQVDATFALGALGVALRYPTYRSGMAPSATGLPQRDAR